MTMSHSESRVVLIWRNGADLMSSSFPAADPSWRTLLKSLAGVPGANVHIRYSRAES
jgi:hypothetical protein